MSEGTSNGGFDEFAQPDKLSVLEFRIEPGDVPFRISDERPVRDNWIAQAGADNTSLKTGQTGWLDRPQVDGASLLRVTAGEEGARLVLYAGQPQGDPIVSYGPFIGDSKRDIARLYTEFQSGQFISLSELVKAAV